MSEYRRDEYQNELADRLEDTIQRCACGCGADCSTVSARCEGCRERFALDCVALCPEPVCEKCLVDHGTALAEALADALEVTA